MPFTCHYLLLWLGHYSFPPSLPSTPLYLFKEVMRPTFSGYKGHMYFFPYSIWLLSLKYINLLSAPSPLLVEITTVKTISQNNGRRGMWPVPASRIAILVVVETCGLPWTVLFLYSVDDTFHEACQLAWPTGFLLQKAALLINGNSRQEVWEPGPAWISAWIPLLLFSVYPTGLSCPKNFIIVAEVISNLGCSGHCSFFSTIRRAAGCVLWPFWTFVAVCLFLGCFYFSLELHNHRWHYRWEPGSKWPTYSRSYSLVTGRKRNSDSLMFYLALFFFPFFNIMLLGKELRYHLEEVLGIWDLDHFNLEIQSPVQVGKLRAMSERLPPHWHGNSKFSGGTESP